MNVVSKERREKNVWFLISLCLLVIAVLNASVTVYYYQGYVNMEKQYKDITTKLKDVSYTVNILIKYDNGTKTWHNQTLVPIGWSLFNVTLKVTVGKVEYSTAYGSPFITAINGVKGSYPYTWMWYLWNATSTTWKLGETGADAYMLRESDVVAWYLVDVSNYPNLPEP